MVYIIRTAYAASASPLVPINFTAVNSPSAFTSAIDLSWITPNPNEDLAGFRIYRDDELIKDLLKGTNFYTDEGLVSGATHSYTITSYSFTNRESRHSTPPEVIQVGFFSGLQVSGKNTYSELGYETPLNADERGFIQHPTDSEFVAQSYNNADFSYIIKIDGKAYGAGLNDRGQLGQGDTLPHTGFVEVMSGVVKMAVGERHALFLDNSGNVYGTGTGSEGQFGDGLNQNYLTPTLIATNVKDISAGGWVSYYLNLTNDLYTTGTGNNNNSGAIGQTINTWTHGLSNVKTMHCSTLDGFAIVSNDDLYGVSRNDVGQLGLGHNNPVYSFQKVAENIKDARAGLSHSLYITTSGDVYGTGENGDGELGQGSTSSPRLNWLFIIGGMDKITAGFNCSGCVAPDKEVFSWGSNVNYRTGRAGSEAEVLIPTSLMFGALDYRLGRANAFVLLGLD